MEQNREPRNRPMYIWSINLQQRSHEYTTGEGHLFNNGVGKTGQPHAKEQNWPTILHHT